MDLSYEDAVKFSNDGNRTKKTNESLEDSIFEWVADRRSRSLIARRKDIQNYAFSLAFSLAKNSGFKVSNR